MTNEQFIESIKLEGEEWRPVVGFEDRYMVSSFGRFASISTLITRKDGKHHFSKQCILVGGTKQDKRGYKTTYRYYSFYKDGVKYTKKAHRMVAEAFIPNPNNYPSIDHLDGDGLNNRVDNLRWCTQKMNFHNEVTYERYKKSMRQRRGKPLEKLRKPIVQLDFEGNLIKKYPYLIACQEDGFDKNAVCYVCQGKRKQHKGYKFMYLSDYELLINMSKNPNGDEN